jgi:hypothetical protein
MKYSTIRIEGSILSADILDKIEQGDIGGQSPKDFGFDTHIKVKDEIAKAWADAHALWQIFKHQREKAPEGSFGTTETRKYWILPLMGFLGYDLDLSKAEIVNDKSYALSHRSSNLDRFPIHIMGFNDSLDKKRTDSGPRMSPHALVQEYLNLTEHLYAIVTNGIHMRLLRDSSRLIKLSFIEFDLESMMEDDHYADFAIMYRLLHSSRMPVKYDAGDDSLIEKFHQDSLDSGSRIREGLSEAVEESIKLLANGFLKHPANDQLREKIDLSKVEGIDVEQYYQFQLRLIYRLLFLIVIEERNLIYPDTVSEEIRDIYYDYYSVNRIRYLSEKRYLMNQKYDDLWTSLNNTFILFENEDKGKALEIKPLSGELFDYGAIGILNECSLDNQVLLECFRNLSLFINKKTGQKMRVNYASLNVEEFGSVYEDLLEYRPEIKSANGTHEFILVRGSERSSSGSHYTPDELVQPLIKHSLDYVIEDKLKEVDKEKALLSIKVCDVACGSGHILLNAARRIGTELAKIKTGEDQPSPSAVRQGVRDAIQKCIYGVDKNPLAVELCKVALWLEAHNPGKPLNFLNHHIKCGDAIVGLAHKDELDLGIPNEAFKRLPDDDKEVTALLSKQNKEERKESKRQKTFGLDSSVNDQLHDVSNKFDRFQYMPEDTKDEREQKQEEYKQLLEARNLWQLKVLADIPVAQFFITKTSEDGNKVITETEYRNFLNGSKPLQGVKVEKAIAIAQKKRFFHWFLEFPDVFKNGGFDCILGNPPFLSGIKISEKYGLSYNAYLVSFFIGASKKTDLCAYFFRRIYQLLSKKGVLALISTNTISQGKTREGGLQVITNSGGDIYRAISSMLWPGKASVVVSLVWIAKNILKIDKYLNGAKVDSISSILSDFDEDKNMVLTIGSNKGMCFQGSAPYAQGLILDEIKASEFLEEKKNKDVVSPFIGGKDLNNLIDIFPPRWIINFKERNLDEVMEYRDLFAYIEKTVKPERMTRNKDMYPRLFNEWWKFWHARQALYDGIEKKNIIKVLARSRVSNMHMIDILPADWTFSEGLIIYVFEDFEIFALLQSSLHQCWGDKYASTMKSDTRYVVSDCFEKFPFCKMTNTEANNLMKECGKEYQQFRRTLINKMNLGLTKIYRQFHNKELLNLEEGLDVKEVKKLSNNETANLWKYLEKTADTCSFHEAVEGIFKLRKLHTEMDLAVLAAYEWNDINLAHDFYEVDYLPENDRIRYTISPEARKEILKRLLELNHEIHEQEEKDGLLEKTKKGSKTKRENDFSNQKQLFGS